MPSHLLVKHLQRNPLVRSARVSRIHRQGFLLSDGVRIRRKGKRRFTVIPMSTASRDSELLVGGMEDGYIAIYPNTKSNPLTVEAFKALLGKPVEVEKPKEEPKPVEPVPAPVPETKSEEEQGYTREDLMAMTKGKLNRIADSMGIEDPRRKGKEVLIDAMFAVGESHG